jgi:3,4-dihydroxy 2-butanone 4-phosphate synthase / GTP cyclohydrolase II
MVPRGPAGPVGAQCVAVDAAAAVTTGISAADRAATVRVLAAGQTDPADLVRPGHVVPVRVPAAGLLARRGRAEAAADLAALAGLRPSGALCELVGTADPTRMAHGAELAAFAGDHGLRLVSVGDVLAYRLHSGEVVAPGCSCGSPAGPRRRL